MANGSGSLVMPRTETPVDVYFTLAVLILVVLMGGLYMFLGFFGVIVGFVILAFTTSVYTISVPEYHALTILDNWWGTQRVIFQGRSAKLPWESAGSLVDVRTELKDVLEETWATMEGAQMDAKYVYLMHVTRTPESIIVYAGYEPSAVKLAAHNLFSMMLSDYFGGKKPEDLLNKNSVNLAVFGTTEGIQKLAVFEQKYGVVITGVALEDVDYDQATQEARDAITNAGSFDKALTILMDRPGMTIAEATRIMKLARFPGVTEWNVNISAPDLQNLQSVSFVGTPPGAGGGAKKGKKP